jgi:hypothetical protein
MMLEDRVEIVVGNKNGSSGCMFLQPFAELRARPDFFFPRAQNADQEQVHQ